MSLPTFDQPEVCKKQRTGFLKNLNKESLKVEIIRPFEEKCLSIWKLWLINYSANLASKRFAVIVKSLFSLSQTLIAVQYALTYF